MDISTIPQWRTADRVRRAIDFADVDKQQWADECGVSIKTVYNWISGHSRPRRLALKELSRLSGVSLEWLETGREQAGDVSNCTTPFPGQLAFMGFNPAA
jgi:hypothetical protein